MSNIVTVDFHGDTLFAVERGDEVFVAVRPIVENIGLDWSSQFRRLKSDESLSKAVAMIATPFSHHGQEEVCLHLKRMNGWLLTIDTRRIKNEEARRRVLL